MFEISLMKRWTSLDRMPKESATQATIIKNFKYHCLAIVLLSLNSFKEFNTDIHGFCQTSQKEWILDKNQEVIVRRNTVKMLIGLVWY